MVQRDYFCMRSDDSNKLRYKFKFCADCPFNECELIEEYVLFSKKHPYPMEPKSETKIVQGCTTVNATRVYLSEDSEEEEKKEYAKDIYKRKLDEGTAVVDNYDGKLSLSYNKREFENGCIMSCRHVNQIECGKKTVTEGIGDHYKIELDYDGIIRENITDKWEPLQPVFISAQTGQGKNYFIENTLIPYVRELNYREKKNYKVLILSNRLALKQQIKNRLDGNDDLDNEEEKIYSYKDCADVMTYQSLLLHEKTLKKKQKYAESRYIYVICDEAHFFTSDAMFNPHTQKILSLIIRLFQDAIRAYMSATPYECLEYIIKYENDYRYRFLNGNKPMHKRKYAEMVFYHFKRDYSYLDVKTYSLINELYEEIVESVSQRKEKWLIFIDDIEKCAEVKAELEKISENMKCPLKVVEDDSKKKDEGGAGTDKDNEAEKNVEKVYAVDANSKKEPIYQDIVKKERLNKDTYVLISTSVLDNGVNLTGIKNIIVSDMLKVKCLQMAGRARVGGVDDRKTLYVKRFGVDEVEKRIADLMRHQDAYHSYELAYEQEEPSASKNYNVYNFFNKYYNGKSCDWEDAKHWFGKPMEEPTKLYINEIAKSLLDKQFSCYQFIRDEMVVESYKGDKMQGDSRIGQKYLEHQFSWFGKKYCLDNDITFADKEKAKKEFIAFLETYAEKGTEFVSEKEMIGFTKQFIELFDVAFGKSDKNSRQYGAKKMNKMLEEQNIGYKINGKPQVGPWTVVTKDNDSNILN